VAIERPLYRYRIRPRNAVTRAAQPSGATLIAREREAILEDFWRGLAEDGWADKAMVRSRPDRPIQLDSDAGAAVDWGVDHLRRIPPLYWAVKRVVRLVMRARQRMR